MLTKIEYDGAGNIISQTEMPAPPAQSISRLAFRRLFRFADRVAMDNAEQGEMSDGAWRTFVTLMADFSAAQEVNLDDADVIEGVTFLEGVGFIPEGDAARILANIPPS